MKYEQCLSCLFDVLKRLPSQANASLYSVFKTRWPAAEAPAGPQCVLSGLSPGDEAGRVVDDSAAVRTGVVATREHGLKIEEEFVRSRFCPGPLVPQRGGVIMGLAVGGSPHSSSACPRKHARPDSSPNSVSPSMSRKSLEPLTEPPWETFGRRFPRGQGICAEREESTATCRNRWACTGPRCKRGLQWRVPSESVRGVVRRNREQRDESPT